MKFRQANVLALGLIANEGPYDAILCRNLLIYLTDEARRVALGSLERVLAPDGLLFTGHAESLEILDPRFRAIQLTGAFTYRRREGAADKPAIPTPQRITRPMDALTSAEASAKAAAPHALVPPLARDLLGEATALADRGELERAVELCGEHLLAAGADARAWTLLGTIRHAGGQRERAEECFTRALYCDPANQVALVQLALLLDRKGDHTGAANLRRRAAKASEDSR